ncbi:PTS transporter subunit EIIC [Companilactobacillus sp. FL22-1]|uniref:PTS transporter subunit EIIC n=1 Tax=Companilactobacillus sp. FL22-1 TaxID=3373892 RepID=UPI0037542EFD
MDYSQDAKTIIANVGGDSNINTLIHCMTRLRFTLKDESKANTSEIEKMDIAIKVMKAQGQYQIVIGNKVTDVFNAILSQLPRLATEDAGETETVAETVSEAPATLGAKFKHGYDEFIGVLTASMMPIIGVLAGSGITKGILAGLVSAGVLSEKAGIFVLINTMADTIFYFLPVILGFTAAKKLGSDPIALAVVGAFLIHPNIIGVAASKVPEIGIWSGFAVKIMNYSGSVFPIIVAAWLGKYVERYVKKVIPEMIQGIFVPIIEIIILSFALLLVVAPIITVLSKGLADGISALLSFNGIIGGAIYGAFYPILVVFGLHWPLIPIVINDLAVNGQSVICALTSITAVGIAGGVFAVAIKTRKKKFEALGYSAGVSALCGISEPSLYGILLKYKRVFYMVMIGNAIGGAVGGAMHLVIYGFTGSLIGFPSFINPKGGIDSNFTAYIISHLVAFLVAFVLTYLFGYSDKMVPSDQEA